MKRTIISVLVILVFLLAYSLAPKYSNRDGPQSSVTYFYLSPVELLVCKVLALVGDRASAGRVCDYYAFSKNDVESARYWDRLGSNSLPP